MNRPLLLAAERMGIPLVKTKLLAYSMGAAFGGMSGAFLGAFDGTVNASQTAAFFDGQIEQVRNVCRSPWKNTLDGRFGVKLPFKKMSSSAPGSTVKLSEPAVRMSPSTKRAVQPRRARVRFRDRTCWRNRTDV